MPKITFQQQGPINARKQVVAEKLAGLAPEWVVMPSAKRHVFTTYVRLHNHVTGADLYVYCHKKQGEILGESPAETYDINKNQSGVGAFVVKFDYDLSADQLVSRIKTKFLPKYTQLWTEALEQDRQSQERNKQTFQVFKDLVGVVGAKLDADDEADAAFTGFFSTKGKGMVRDISISNHKESGSDEVDLSFSGLPVDLAKQLLELVAKRKEEASNEGV